LNIKKADISISLVATLVLAVIGILLYFTFVGNSQNSSSVYCSTVYQLVKLFSKTEDPQCTLATNLTIYKPVKEEIILNTFADRGREKKFTGLGTYAFALENDSEVTSAIVTIASSSATTVNVGILGDASSYTTVTLLPDSYMLLNLTQGTQNALSVCAAFSCPIQIEVKSISNPPIWIKNLTVVYKRYDIAQALLNRITLCWDRALRGSLNKSFACEEFVIPQNYAFKAPITEQSLTDMLVQQRWCHVLANNETNPSCGTEDNLAVQGQIDMIKNLLIEYDAAQKKIMVS
jgi:hypothetical protein